MGRLFPPTLRLLNNMNKVVITDSAETSDGPFGNTCEIIITPNGHGVEIHPVGTSTHDGGAPIYLELYKGQLRLFVWGDIDSQDPTSVISLQEAMESTKGQVVESVRKFIPATYTSVWGNGVKIPTICKYDPIRREVFDIEVAEVDTDGNLVDEYVTIKEMELRSKDGVVFNY